MTTNNFNTARAVLPHMLRSQGPLSAFDDKFLNDPDRYVRSYNIINRHTNVNTSFQTVNLQVKKKRKQLVAKIARLLGEYPRHWFAEEFRPRNLPLHPLDWSTILLQDLHNEAQLLPPHYTSDQRLAEIHRYMFQENQRQLQRNASASAARAGNIAEPYNKRTEANDASVHREPTEVERLQREIQRLKDKLGGIEEEYIHDLGRMDRMEELETKRRALATGNFSSHPYEECLRDVERLPKEIGFPYVPYEDD